MDDLKIIIEERDIDFISDKLVSIDVFIDGLCHFKIHHTNPKRDFLGRFTK